MELTDRTIRLILIVVAAVSLLVVFAPTSSAIAETTSLCQEDPGDSPCPEGQMVTHVHLVSIGKGKLETSVGNAECTVLFLGDASGKSEEPLVISSGAFTYTNCELGKSSCTAKEENGPSEIKVLREGNETAKVTGEGLVHVVCSGFIDCSYTGVGLVATATGPLFASATTGEVKIKEKTLSKETGGFQCPKTGKLTLSLESLSALYLGGFKSHKTALCTADDSGKVCVEEHKPSTIEFKDSAAEFLTSLLNTKCESSFSGSVGAAGEPQIVTGTTFKFSGCTSGCVVTEVSGGSELKFLFETSKNSTEELASATTGKLEIFFKCGETVKCTFGPISAVGHVLGALKTGDNGHIAFGKASLGKGEGVLCPTEASLDALFVASSAIYIRETYGPTSLCSKDEKSPVCKSENQLKTIDYKDKALELLTNVINVKCEGLASGSVGEPGGTLEVKPELTFSNCGGGCFVTVVSGPGKVVLERLKSEEATATAEGFEIFVKCGTTIKCLLGPEKMVGTALGALTTGDNGHLTFSKVSMGKGEGATCPTEAKLDTTLIASSAAYIG